ncbi:MAG: hypothetical protein OXU81_04070 [Gammaproteobacteria bacterium]|nr:hypothetical protein [Gammaproteobacteria bacterium]
MTRRHFDGRRRSRRRRGPIKRVTRGLADAFGVPRGVIIAGFVLGFVFIPLLSLLAFLAALYWVNDPERARRQVDSFFESLRRAGVRLRHGAAEPRYGGDEADSGRGSREPPRPAVHSPALARRFERLERRARAIEEFVASEEFRLNREFRRMERE